MQIWQVLSFTVYQSKTLVTTDTQNWLHTLKKASAYFDSYDIDLLKLLTESDITYFNLYIRF